MPHIKSSVRSSGVAFALTALLVAAAVLSFSHTALAGGGGDNTGGSGFNPPTGGSPFNPPTGGDGSYFEDLGGNNNNDTDSTELMNPLASDSLVGFLLDLIDILILFAIPLIVLMIIYAGFLYVMARGNEEQVTKATRALTYAIIGGLLILGAKLLLEIIEGTVDQLVR